MFAAEMQITDQDARSVTSVTGGAKLGQIASTSGGRTYRYALAGGSNLVAGNLQVNADVVANHVNRPVAAAVAIGGTTVTVTLGATAATADQYADGYMTVNDVTGEGISYGVSGNLAAASSGTLTVYLKEPITVALTTSSEVTMTVHPYSAVVISATDQADQPVGVPNTAVTAAYYCWLQVGGICSVLWDEAVTKGLALTIGTGTAGAVEALDGAGEPQIGIATMAGVDTENQPAYLTMW